MKRHKGTLVAVALLIAMTTGCATLKSSSSESDINEAPVSVFDFEGMPAQDYYVGGGFTIRYRAQSDGVLYIAEDESDRLLGTVSMSEGEKYQVIYDINDEDMLINLKAVGIDPANALIKIYFVPKSDFQ